MEKNKNNREDDTPKNGNNGTTHPSAEQPQDNEYDNSAIYRKDPKTGKWIVQNPAASTGYNYLYRDLTDWYDD